ncbi:MAG: PadR family transcriptional regulator [Eubacteriales bacterium]|nr:PadR family transcriptional regulator [Eubacteriales bacterium]
MPRKPNETGVPERSGSAAGMEDNLKKAVAEMLVLFLLNEREMYIGEIPEELNRRSGGVFHIVFPYSIIYRMVKFEYIEELKKRIAPDGRRRQYYAITPKGREYLNQLRGLFAQFTAGIHTILSSEGEQYAERYSSAEVCQADDQAADLRRETEMADDPDTVEDGSDFSGRLSGCFI